MALFKRRDPNSAPAAPTATPFDPQRPWRTHAPPASFDHGNPYATAHQAAIAQGDWRRAREALLAAPRAIRTWVANARAWGEPVDPTAVEHWRAEAPDDPWGLYCHALVVREHARHARGAGYADTVAEDGFDRFFDLMRMAEAELFEAARALPSEVDPWAQLVDTGVSLQIPLEELTSRFDACQARSPWDPVAVAFTLQALCAKWSGSDEMMWSFARMAAREAPEGSPAIAALPQAHLEHALRLQPEGPTAYELLKSYQSKAELREALQRSVLHPAFSWDGPGLDAANTFACAVFQSGLDPETAAIMQRLQRRYTDMPWAYFSAVPTSFAYQAEVVSAREMGLPEPPLPPPWVGDVSY